MRHRMKQLMVGWGSVVAAGVQPMFALSASSSYASSTTTITQSPSLVSTGLRNLANTCYINAQLQCHFHIPKVREILLKEEDDDSPIMKEEEQQQQQQQDEASASASLTKRSIPAQALRLTFAEMQQAATGPTTIASPAILCRALGINVYQQQDSQEFWKLLLPALELPSLLDLYQGAYQSYIKAADGNGRERRREEPFLDLSINVDKQTNLKMGLTDEFTEPELLAGDNGWRPEKDAPKIDAYKGQQLVASGLPPILQFHLKRFQYDWQRDAMTKLNGRFELPVELDLNTIVEPTKMENDVAAASSSSSCQYDLQSIVVHDGAYGSGHYYSYVRPDVRSDRWYRFNDHVVEEVSLKEVEEDSFGGSQPKKGGLFGRLFGRGGRSGSSFGWGGRDSSAYCVQYIRRSDIGKLYDGEKDEESADACEAQQEPLVVEENEDTPGKV